MNSSVVLIIFVFVALVFLVACFVAGFFIKSSGKEKQEAKKELELVKFKLEKTKEEINNKIKEAANKEIQNIESLKYKKQADQLKELYKDLQKDLEEIERRIKQIRGEN